MRIREGDEWKTAFRIRYGHFKYQVMPFGLSNAPASFQGYVNKIVAEIDVFDIVCLDDILIYTEDLGQGHVETSQWVLDILWKHGLFANLKKCRFHKDEVRFLGYVVSAWGQEWKMRRSKQSRPGSIQSQYDEFRCALDSPTSIGVSSRGSVRSPPTHLDAQDAAASTQPQRSMVMDDEVIGGRLNEKSVS